jgi:hypothetical protein
MNLLEELDPIISSSLAGFSMFCIVFVVLAVSRPKNFTYVNIEKETRTSWEKIVIVSFVAWFATALCVFLVLAGKRTVEFTEPPKIDFTEKRASFGVGY